jgi:hypothetical protein
VELRLGHDVVVERPERPVGEALVELLDLTGAEGDGNERETVLDERLDLLLAGGAGPADPGAVVGPQHGLEGGDQAAGGAAPRHGAIRLVHPVDGQAVGHDDEVCLLGWAHGATLTRTREGEITPRCPHSIADLAVFVQTTRRRRMTSLSFVA